MKIEKLTENKIRVIIHLDELGLNNTNVPGIITKSLETQDIFSGILKKAEQEVDFHTDGCKLLIEAFSSLEDTFIFTITKYLPDNDTKKKKLTVKRKSFNNKNEHVICQFVNFDTFCDFCIAIKHIDEIYNVALIKNSSLYLWKNTYYLVLKNANTKHKNMNKFYSTLSEFGKFLSFSNNFEHKLLEHGKVIIKKNAIDVGIKFFAD